jgi:hypothetical protein
LFESDYRFFDSMHSRISLQLVGDALILGSSNGVANLFCV